MRDYGVMRRVLSVVAKSDGPCFLNDFLDVEPQGSARRELARLAREGLISGVSFDSSGACSECEIDGLTAEGIDFYRLIENDEVWAIVSETLGKARIDVSYPLLKEVCEEIVKRYVTSFIPEM